MSRRSRKGTLGQKQHTATRWRGLLRLSTAGSRFVSNDMTKDEVTSALRGVLGAYAPTSFKIFRNCFEAFAWVLSEYTGSRVDERLARRCVANRSNRGYEYTAVMSKVLAGLPWPPPNNPPKTPRTSISTPPSCFKSASRLSEWEDIEGEFSPC